VLAHLTLSLGALGPRLALQWSTPPVGVRRMSSLVEVVCEVIRSCSVMNETKRVEEIKVNKRRLDAEKKGIGARLNMTTTG
jgi:hypothetical protein